MELLRNITVRSRWARSWEAPARKSVAWDPRQTSSIEHSSNLLIIFADRIGCPALSAISSTEQNTFEALNRSATSVLYIDNDIDRILRMLRDWRATAPQLFNTIAVFLPHEF